MERKKKSTQWEKEKGRRGERERCATIAEERDTWRGTARKEEGKEKEMTKERAREDSKELATIVASSATQRGSARSKRERQRDPREEKENGRKERGVLMEEQDWPRACSSAMKGATVEE